MDSEEAAKYASGDVQVSGSVSNGWQTSGINYQLH